jgi:hypothetical protein
MASITPPPNVNTAPVVLVLNPLFILGFVLPIKSVSIPKPK